MPSDPVVLVPRAAPGLIGEALRAVGLHPRALVVTEVQPTPGLALPNGADLVLFTSAAAVRAVGVPRGLARAVCVGPATAAAAAALGWTVDAQPPGTGAEVVAGLGGLSGQTVLWPRAADPAPDTAPAVRAAGATLIEVVAYTLAAAADLEDRLRAALPADLLLGLSPSGLRWLGAAADRLGVRLPPVVAIGPTTAEAARQLALPLRAVAASPTPEALAAACRAALAG